MFLQHVNDGICGVKHQLAFDKVTNSLYSLPSVHSLNQEENVVLDQVPLGVMDSVQSKISLRKQPTFWDATTDFHVI